MNLLCTDIFCLDSQSVYVHRLHRYPLPSPFVYICMHVCVYVCMYVRLPIQIYIFPPPRALPLSRLSRTSYACVIVVRKKKKKKKKWTAEYFQEKSEKRRLGIIIGRGERRGGRVVTRGSRSPEIFQGTKSLISPIPPPSPASLPLNEAAGRHRSLRERTLHAGHRRVSTFTHVHTHTHAHGIYPRRTARPCMHRRARARRWKCGNYNDYSRNEVARAIPTYQVFQLIRGRSRRKARAERCASDVAPCF